MAEDAYMVGESSTLPTLNVVASAKTVNASVRTIGFATADYSIGRYKVTISSSLVSVNRFELSVVRGDQAQETS